jgi:hypothetical protein
MDQEQATRFARALRRFHHADERIAKADPIERVRPADVEEYLDARSEFQTELTEAGELR